MRTTLRAFATLSLLATCLSGQAAAQSLQCEGRNLLDALKTSDAAAHDAVRKAASGAVNATTRLWKIEHEDARGASYLMATVPVTDDRVLRLTPAVQEALSNVRRVAVDVANLEPLRLQEGLSTLHSNGKLVLRDGSTLASHLTPAEQQTTGRALGRSGLPADLATRAQPWAVMALMRTSECEQRRIRSGKPLMTAHLAALAEQRGLGTVDLETVETQFEAIAALPQAVQLALLKGWVAVAAQENDYSETTAQLYLAKDLGAIWPLQAALAKKAGVDEATLQTYHDEVVVARAKRLGNRLHQHISRGGVLVAIDYSMLIGDSGLVAQVKEMGFTVTVVE